MILGVAAGIISARSAVRERVHRSRRLALVVTVIALSLAVATRAIIGMLQKTAMGA